MSYKTRIRLNPPLKLATYLKPSSDNATRPASLRNRRGRFNRGALDEKRARAFRSTGRAHQRHVKLGGAFERAKGPRAQN